MDVSAMASTMSLTYEGHLAVVFLIVFFLKIKKELQSLMLLMLKSIKLSFQLRIGLKIFCSLK